MSYFDALTYSMLHLATDPRTVFLGQQVEYSGSGIHETLSAVDANKLIEMPIAEDFQMGVSIGLSLTGKIPVSIYPRFDFLLLATNQLVNMLDKIGRISVRRFSPKVIIRTAVGATKPLYPGLQHSGDYTSAFKCLLETVEVVSLLKTEQIEPAYHKALNANYSTLLIEYQDLY